MLLHLHGLRLGLSERGRGARNLGRGVVARLFGEAEVGGNDIKVVEGDFVEVGDWDQLEANDALLVVEGAQVAHHTDVGSRTVKT